MKHLKTRVLLSGLAIVLFVAASLIDQSAATRQNTPPKPPAREEAYRANNVGVALLEQYKHKEAADAFKRALQLEPSLSLARVNLGIALFNMPDLPAAQRELQSAATASPNAPQPHYVLGLLAKSLNKPAEAIASFQKVLTIDPQDVGANVNLGQLYAQQRKYPEAVAVLRTALAAEPYNTTALYNLGTALMRSGQREEGQKIIQQFQVLRERGSGTTLGTNYLEQGRYAEAISSTGAEPELVDKAAPDVKFTDVTATALPPLVGDWPNGDQPDGAVLLFDYDGDGDLDLLEVAGVKPRLMRNDNGKFVETPQTGTLGKVSKTGATAAIAGDFDNDEKPDLFILRPGASALYHNDGNGSFSDVTAAAKIPNYETAARAIAFVDYDHDGDLDLFIAGQPQMLLRNNGDRTFTEQTTEAKLSDKLAARAVVPTDFDNRRDVDLLVASTEKVSLWRNLRDGSFRDVAADVGLGEIKNVASVAAGDVNKDGFTDFYFGGSGFALSNGKERFQLVRASDETNVSQFLDYDNDGLLDLVTASNTGIRVLRNAGGTFVEATTLKGTRSTVLSSGDLDNDGDTDLVFGVPGGGLRIARNDGGNVNRSLRVGLAGKVSNRTGVGAKIEIRTGSLAQKLETYSAYPAPAPADVVFGIGKRTGVDAVRVLWPAGIVQAETEIAAAAPAKTALAISLTELDRKPSSCPYLYVWNGERFVFVTDFLGGGEMGHLDAPGVYNAPDPDEYVRIDGDLLKPRDGRYELRVTNELEEALFVDRVQLISVAHPRGVEVYPNEGLTVPPPAFKLYSTSNAQPPAAAVDEHGHDVLARLAHVDREYPDDFQRHQIRGYADEHTLTLTLNQVSKRTLLLLTGWTDYAWSSDNLAAFQSGKSLSLPALQVKDKQGRWRTVVENIGIPVGRPQTVVVDLSGKFLSDSREVRIVTNMRIYWDQILVDTSAGNFPTQLTRLSPAVADLRWRGFSREYSPDGRQPMTYDYRKVSFTSPWKVMTGRYTREGDVRELLHATDDMFVISRPGDELVLSFAADKLPPLPEGWTRTFLLYADGFSKEMDINSASPDQVGPLPFHGMSKYPYSWPERYPLTPERQRYLETYNTRVVTSPVPSIALELVALDLMTKNE
ncbi:MAG TPA: FG-GAP-like repeat-containing protein [Pyrinomonadaceae bacterium]|nr:FG-GAP-like repeat-containing protein [Pyrinomonadaceae bacterium]